MSKRNNSSQDQPPKKRRNRKKKEKQTILPREKAIISSFPRKFTPRSADKVAKTLGRKKQWVMRQQMRLVKKEELLEKKVKVYE